MKEEVVTIKATISQWAHLLDLIDVAATNQNNHFLAEKLVRLAEEMIGKNLFKQKGEINND